MVSNHRNSDHSNIGYRDIQTGSQVVRRKMQGSFDIVFKLMNDESRYYINRGIESGLSVEELKEVLLGKEVYITYPPHWSFLDPMNTTKHISKLATRNEIFYSEF